jgi:hypothetical protein
MTWNDVPLHGHSYVFAKFAFNASVRMQVRGPVVAQWARHLATVWRDKPFWKDIQLNDAALQVYSNFEGVPPALWKSAAAVADDAEAAELHQALAADRQGYASTRIGSAEEQAAGLWEQQPGTTAFTCMTGLHDMEIHVDMCAAADWQEALAAAAKNVSGCLGEGSTLVSAVGTPDMP